MIDFPSVYNYNEYFQGKLYVC